MRKFEVQVCLQGMSCQSQQLNRAPFNGKNFKGSLETHDRKTAEHKLGEFVKKIEQKESGTSCRPVPGLLRQMAHAWKGVGAPLRRPEIDGRP
jgi:hypothetical protein